MAHETEGRAFIERIWEDCAQYLDANLAERAPTLGLVPTFWELYLAYALKKNGVRLVPRSVRVPPREGPDLFAEAPDVWVEAYAATCGEGSDALEWGHGRAPNDQFVLRLREGIHKKGVQLTAHAGKGYIKLGQPTVIAISGAMLPYRFGEQLIPYIVHAVLAVGNLVLHFARATMKPTSRILEYRDQITKVSKSPVNTDVFLNDDHFTCECGPLQPVVLGSPPGDTGRGVYCRTQSACTDAATRWMVSAWQGVLARRFGSSIHKACDTYDG